MWKIELYRDEDGNIRIVFNGKDMLVTELNVPLLAQLYKQTGQLPSFALRDKNDAELSVVSHSLTESIKDIASRL